MFLGVGQPAIPPLGVEPLVSDELVNSEYELQAHWEETSARFGFMRTRGASNPPLCSSSPPHPVDPIEFRRILLIDKEETLQIMKEKEAAFRLELDKTLASFKSEMEKVMQNVFDQFRLGRTSQLTPPPFSAQQPPREHSSTPLSDSETTIPIVHSHLWKARCKEVARTSMRATGGVKKPHSFRLGASTLHKTGKYQKLNFRSLAASLLLDDAILAQSNHNPTSFGLVSGTSSSIPNFSFIMNSGCGGIDYVPGAKLSGVDVICDDEKRKSDMKVKMDSGDGKKLSELEGVTVRQDIQGPNLGENGRECDALHLLDEMSKSNELCNAGRTNSTLTSIRDKGGGHVHQPLEYAIWVNYKEEDEYFDKSVGRDDEVDDGHAISKLELSTQLVRNDKLTIVLREKVHNDGMVISGLNHVIEIMITGEARVICTRFDENVLGDAIEKVLVPDSVVNLSGCLETKDNCNPTKLESNDNSVGQEVEVVIMGGSKVQQQFVPEPFSSVPINYDMGICSTVIMICPKKICHYVLLPCSSGFDKKVSDKGSGRSLLTEEHLVLDKESTCMWLWVSLSNWIAALRPLRKPRNAYTKVYSSSTNFSFGAVDVVETIVKSQSCWEEFCLMFDDIWGWWKSTIIAANDYCTEELCEIFPENHMKLDGKCLGYVLCALELVKKLAAGPNLGDSVCIEKFVLFQVTATSSNVGTTLALRSKLMSITAADSIPSMFVYICGDQVKHTSGDGEAKFPSATLHIILVNIVPEWIVDS